METRVTYRTSEETVKRLQELSDKYGVSQSALLTLLVNERWLAENVSRPTLAVTSPDLTSDPEPPPNFPDGYQQPVSGKKKKRKRRH